MAAIQNRKYPALQVTLIATHSISKHFQSLAPEYHRTRKETRNNRTDNAHNMIIRIAQTAWFAKNPSTGKKLFLSIEFLFSVRVSHNLTVNFCLVNRQKWDSGFPANFVEPMLADFWISDLFCCAFWACLLTQYRNLTTIPLSVVWRLLLFWVKPAIFASPNDFSTNHDLQKYRTPPKTEISCNVATSYPFSTPYHWQIWRLNAIRGRWIRLLQTSSLFIAFIEPYISHIHRWILTWVDIIPTSVDITIYLGLKW